MLSLCGEDGSEKDAALFAKAMSIFDDYIVNDGAHTLQVVFLSLLWGRELTGFSCK